MRKKKHYIPFNPNFWDPKLNKSINVPNTTNHCNFHDITNHFKGFPNESSLFYKYVSTPNTLPFILRDLDVYTAPVNIYKNIKNIQYVYNKNINSFKLISNRIYNVDGKTYTLTNLTPEDNIKRIYDLKTEYFKELSKCDKTTVCKQYRIYPSKEQVLIINGYSNECKKLYDKLVTMYYENNTNKIMFDKSYKIIKKPIFDIIYGDNPKPAPYDMLTDVIKEFCQNIKSTKTNKKRGNITDFEIKPKNISKSHSLYLRKGIISNNTFYSTLLGEKIDGMNLDITMIKADCRLICDKINNKYYLKVPIHKRCKFIKNREPVVALDPGEKIFLAYHGLNSFGMIGINPEKKILGIEKKIKKISRIIKKGINKKGKKISKKNINILTNRRQSYYDQIKNYTKELRNKAANF